MYRRKLCLRIFKNYLNSERSTLDRSFCFAQNVHDLAVLIPGERAGDSYRGRQVPLSRFKGVKGENRNSPFVLLLLQSKVGPSGRTYGVHCEKVVFEFLFLLYDVFYKKQVTNLQFCGTINYHTMH